MAPLRGGFLVHVDLHETTDSDESGFRPALAARDGKPFEPGGIPDGFYLVDDSANPQPAFQEGYPDSPRATPEQCIAAQVAAVRAGLDHALR